ncbi:MAG: DegV family protein [Erysipelotrichia bacterium]|nr:DegV family protein [Erysipelotrichia bacterium]
MRIALSVETTADLPKELLTKYDLFLVPFTVMLGEQAYFDGEITAADIFAFVDKTKILPTTAAVNVYTYKEHFNKILAKGYDAIIHFTIGTGFSASYSNAIVATEDLKNVHIIDSMNLSTGIALLAIYARELVDKGLDLETIISKVKARIPYVRTSFVVHTLDYLHKGGRCSGLERVGAALLRLKPQIIVLENKMVPAKKYFGRRVQVIEQYSKDVMEEMVDPDLKYAFVTHTMANPEMIKAAKSALVKRGFKNIYETQAGATITSHCGPLALGVLFIDKQPEE